MSLEGMAKRNNILVLVQPLTKLAEIPVVECVIDLQDTVDGRWRGLLACVLNITERNVVSLVETDCNECSKTWQFKAAGMCLCQHTQLRDSTFGSIKVGTQFLHTVRLDKSCPHQTEDLGWLLR